MRRPQGTELIESHWIDCGNRSPNGLRFIHKIRKFNCFAVLKDSAYLFHPRISWSTWVSLTATKGISFHFGPSRAQIVRFFTQNPSLRPPKSGNCTIFHTKSVALAPQERKVYDFSYKIRHLAPPRAQTVRFFTQNPSHRPLKSGNCMTFHTKSVTSAPKKRKLYDFSHKIRHIGPSRAQTV